MWYCWRNRTNYTDKASEILVPQMLNCSWFQSFVSDPVKRDPILDQLSMITWPYTRLNGLKTIRFPAVHSRIANIWEYPPPAPPGYKVLFESYIKSFNNCIEIMPSCSPRFCQTIQPVLVVHTNYINKVCECTWWSVSRTTAISVNVFSQTLLLFV